MFDWRETSQDFIVAIILIFFGAFLCFLAWNGWAWEFNLPQFSYWHWVATFAAFRYLTGRVKKG
jgi:hypothetical protein